MHEAKHHQECHNKHLSSQVHPMPTPTFDIDIQPNLVAYCDCNRCQGLPDKLQAAWTHSHKSHGMPHDAQRYLEHNVTHSMRTCGAWRHPSHCIQQTAFSNVAIKTSLGMLLCSHQASWMQVSGLSVCS